MTIPMTTRLLAAAAMLLSFRAVSAQPATEGVFDDWSGVAALATDPAGDSTGVIDVTTVKAQSRGTRLYVQFDTTAVLNLPDGPAGTTLRLVVGRGNRTITINFRARTATYFNGSINSALTWHTLGFTSAPTAASNRFELELDTAVMGTLVGDQLRINFTGGDSLASDVFITLSEPALVPARRSSARTGCTDLRVASLNTYVSGFADPARRDRFVRLIDSVNADVYCFQEEYDGTLAQAQAIIALADPLDDGAPWQVIKAGELVVASPHVMHTVNMGTSAYQGVVVVRPGGEAVFVINNHMKCCGYVGSPEDTQRISQAQTAINAYNSFRAGSFGPVLAPYADAPAIVVGDWNHVGGPVPLDLWLATPGPGMTHAVVRHLIGGEVWTWAAPSGTGFWPGLLDLVAFDASRAAVVRSFVLDTAELLPDELASMGLLSGDSTASDHRMVVVDLSDGPSADLNSDSSVNTPDLTFFLARFGLGSSAGPDVRRCDFNRDGIVNTPDLVYLLARFGIVCE